MNGKEVEGRFLKVDFDVKQQQKSSYHINMDNNRNKLYNREPLKLERTKQIKKEKERQKLAKIKGRSLL